MSQLKLVFATVSTTVQLGPGNPYQIQEGDVYRASDPLVRGRRELFTDDPRAVLKTSVPIEDDDEDDETSAVADTTKGRAVEQLERDLSAAHARIAELEAEAAEGTAKDDEGTDVDVDSPAPYEGYRTEAELARAKAESEEGVSEGAPVEGYKTKAQAAKAEAESEKGVSAEAPVDGYRTKAEAAKAEAESKEDVAGVEPEAPVEQATRAPGEKRTTRRNRG